ncbi:hypothetical protein [uncultured Microbulbifer sp.]|uniref:hypothetical protein n=1 Tax=uncultured Microbulbifer sp. TaxID=348147 RepID=UPI00260DA44C|nr:hypothetical protein [uncultured Microbulbifer sp.]
MRAIIFVIYVILISACYPINKTIQPHAEIVVVDERGNPVCDAVVTLIAGAYPYGEERTRMSIKTDDSGKAITSDCNVTQLV